MQVICQLPSNIWNNAKTFGINASTEIIELFSIYPPPVELKMKLMKEIAESMRSLGI
jgi:hypothetical protein